MDVSVHADAFYVCVCGGGRGRGRSGKLYTYQLILIGWVDVDREGLAGFTLIALRTQGAHGSRIRYLKPFLSHARALVFQSVSGAPGIKQLFPK